MGPYDPINRFCRRSASLSPGRGSREISDWLLNPSSGITYYWHRVESRISSSQQWDADMIVTNTETIAGYDVVEVKGIVQGNTVRAKHAGRDFAAGLKNLVGGELKGYTELLTESRREALQRMLAQAQQLEANAVVNVRFTTSAVTSGAAELYAYGTAVSVEPSPL
jgi:uncharacterized protein YbjQ (UPF0145 family)